MILYQKYKTFINVIIFFIELKKKRTEATQN